MRDIKTFVGPVKEDLNNYKNYYKSTLKSKTKILDILSNFVHSRKSNNIIPLITLLSAKITGNINKNTYIAASIIDHLYTATLIHDDVEEESYSKNGPFNLGGLWKTKLSVLMGDYFLARGLLLSIENKNYNLLEIFSKSVKEITEGELTILYSTRNLFITKEEYFDIINKKAASLYSACAIAGGLSTGANKESTLILSSFGKNYGSAFFIKKELEFSGCIKNSRYRISLPLILSLDKCSNDEKYKILKYLQYPVQKELTKYFQSFIESKGGKEEAIRYIQDYKIKAIEDITEFPYSENMEALKQLVNSTL